MEGAMEDGGGGWEGGKAQCDGERGNDDVSQRRSGSGLMEGGFRER